MALANQAAAEAKKWLFTTRGALTVARVWPDAQGEAPIEVVGTSVADCVAKCSGWDDHRTERGKSAVGVR
jgi:hypothetical protein